MKICLLIAEKYLKSNYIFQSTYHKQQQYIWQIMNIYQEIHYNLEHLLIGIDYLNMLPRGRTKRKHNM